jgi:hypothetical protein
MKNDLRASTDSEAATKPPATSGPAPTPSYIRRIALHAQLCEATVRRFLAGKAVRPGSRERIERAMSAKRTKGGAS